MKGVPGWQNCEFGAIFMAHQSSKHRRGSTARGNQPNVLEYRPPPKTTATTTSLRRGYRSGFLWNGPNTVTRLSAIGCKGINIPSPQINLKGLPTLVQSPANNYCDYDRSVGSEFVAEPSDWADASLRDFLEVWPNGFVSMEVESISLESLARMAIAAVDRGRAMAKEKRDIAEILRECEERLRVCKFALDDMRSKPGRLRTGLANVIAFGRMITFGIVHLRHLVPDFEEWYGPKVQEMRDDPVMAYFYGLRNKVEKEAKNVPVKLSFHIKALNFPRDFGPRPPGATHAFIMDQEGASAWAIASESGVVEKYYVQLPPDAVDVFVGLPGAPPLHGNPNASAVDLATVYVAGLEALVREAQDKWVPRPSPKSKMFRIEARENAASRAALVLHIDSLKSSHGACLYALC